MTIEHRIDDLIEAGWGVVNSDFDPAAFQRWKQKAHDCLSAIVGPDHIYTKRFANFVRQAGKTDLLAASGILSAAKDQLNRSNRETDDTDGKADSVSPH